MTAGKPKRKTKARPQAAPKSKTKVRPKAEPIGKQKRKHKVMVVAAEPEAKEALQGILQPPCDVTTVDSVRKAAETADKKDFDLVVKDYVLPQISGSEAILEIKAAKGTAAEKKAELLMKVREAVKKTEMDFQAQKSATEELYLRASRAKLDEIVDLLDDRIRQLENEKAGLNREIHSVTEQLSAAVEEKAETAKELAGLKAKMKESTAELKTQIETLRNELGAAALLAETTIKEKAEVEKKAEQEIEELIRNNEALGAQVTVLQEELDQVAGLAETALNEKNQLEDKLAQLQETWDKYIAGE